MGAVEFVSVRCEEALYIIKFSVKVTSD